MSAKLVDAYHVTQGEGAPFSLFELLMRIMQGARRIHPQHAPFILICRPVGPGGAVSEVLFRPGPIYFKGKCLVADGTVGPEDAQRPACLLTSLDLHEKDVLRVEVGVENTHAQAA
jgi:hypothetical protein